MATMMELTPELRKHSAFRFAPRDFVLRCIRGNGPLASMKRLP
jgi:hypothetical protein